MPAPQKSLRTRNIRAEEPNTSNQQFSAVQEYFHWFMQLPPSIRVSLDTNRARNAREILNIVGSL